MKIIFMGTPEFAAFLQAQRDQDDRRSREHHGEQVVLFQNIVVRFVVAAVPVPKQAVHDVAMHGPGEDLHPEDGHKEQQDHHRQGHDRIIGGLNGARHDLTRTYVWPSVRPC